MVRHRVLVPAFGGSNPSIPAIELMFRNRSLRRSIFCVTVINMNALKFTKNLVKGRVAETVFSQMLRNAECFTVLEFGYEKVIPDLLQYNHGHEDAIIETLRTAPDFAVINLETKEVRLVEVKYRRRLNPDNIKQIAEKMHASWNPSYLFIATLDGFYFDEINKIIDNQGLITPLVHPRIPAEVQQQYLQILRDFEENN